VGVGQREVVLTVAKYLGPACWGGRGHENTDLGGILPRGQREEEKPSALSGGRVRHA